MAERRQGAAANGAPSRPGKPVSTKKPRARVWGWSTNSDAVWSTPTVVPNPSAWSNSSARERSARRSWATRRITSRFMTRKNGWLHSSPVSASGEPSSRTNPSHWARVPMTQRTQPSPAGSTQ